MQRELSSFPLAPHHLHKLTNCGYLKAEDLQDVSPTELSEGDCIYNTYNIIIINSVKKLSRPGQIKSISSSFLENLKSWRIGYLFWYLLVVKMGYPWGKRAILRPFDVGLPLPPSPLVISTLPVLVRTFPGPFHIVMYSLQRE